MKETKIKAVLEHLKTKGNISPLEACTEIAYNEIKNRKGETKNGTFIREK